MTDGMTQSKPELRVNVRAKGRSGPGTSRCIRQNCDQYVSPSYDGARAVNNYSISKPLGSYRLSRFQMDEITV